MLYVERHASEHQFHDSTKSKGISEILQSHTLSQLVSQSARLQRSADKQLIEGNDCEAEKETKKKWMRATRQIKLLRRFWSHKIVWWTKISFCHCWLGLGSFCMRLVLCSRQSLSTESTFRLKSFYSFTPDCFTFIATTHSLHSQVAVVAIVEANNENGAEKENEKRLALSHPFHLFDCE